ncbi:glycosyltransferase [Winogradskyella sp.]|jgi:glycosyltransferase involved in cell wall biosynthesis|uniref:glycosyltransferase n=1 Tax=Winogradskyella sp. TaxID=1883156 RepID=UPI0025F51220|nr:glycosyltransferase [Winogradskyella sp.]MCT4630352.1 glycosyltransferase [Winogradskyella sp.]
MIQNRDIIIVGIQAWDIEIGSNCKNIAQEFAKHNRVLYVNPPLNWVTRLKQKHKESVQKRIQIAKGKREDIEIIEDNLWNLFPKTTIDSINWIKSHSLFKLMNKRNSRKFAMDIKSAADRLGFKDYILFNDSSMFLGLHLKEYLKPEVYTYYVRDNLVKDPYWKKHGARMEPEVIKEADVVVNNSEYYVDYSSKFNSNSFMVGQGCDVSMFNDEKGDIKEAVELKEIPKPIIGYVGTLTTLRLDVDLLEFIAKQREDWNIVLVGPEDETFKKSNLHNLSNVHFLGNKPMDSLPTYIKGFDVTMNPQVLNEITIGNYPRKIDEYLAMGKPIVATYTKAMEMFNDYVYLGKTKEDYIDLISQALEEDSNQVVKERIEYANSHTWPNSVKDIYKAMKSVVTIEEEIKG